MSQRLKVICYPVNHTGPNSQKHSLSTAVAIIPSRFESTRLPGKALLDIAGKPMILWVIERAEAARNVQRVIVATDDERIREVVESSGHEAVMTSREHNSGTDRLAEVAAKLPEAEIIVNVQGDEPLISPQTIELAINTLAVSDRTVGMATTWETIETGSDVLDPNVVKVVVDGEQRAVYFSRSPVPHPAAAVSRHGSVALALKQEPELICQFKKHTGLYVYRRDVLLDFARWPSSELERTERLEQLRALEHGVTIKAVQAKSRSMGIDTQEDLQRLREMVSSSEFVVSNANSNSCGNEVSTETR